MLRPYTTHKKGWSMAGEFQDKVVVITGASGNLGSAVTRRFAAEGAKLVLVERNLDKLKTLAAELTNEVLTIAADATSAVDAESLVQQVEARFGQIDVLAHTIGGFLYGKPVHEGGLDDLEKMLALNVRPLYATCGRIARHMLDKGVSGKIVVVVSRAAVAGAANLSAYTAAKAAALRVVESMALELRDKGIHVNAISPSIIDTLPNRADMPKADFSKWVTVEQIADGIAFLASDRAGGIYGTNLEVYGRV